MTKEELEQKNKVLAQNLEDTEIINKALEKENAELKEQISTKDILIKELQEQKVYWKESSFDWRHKFFKLDKVKRLIKKDKQLTKAKEIIKELSKSLFLAKGIVRDLIDDTVDFKESKERASYCYEQESFDTYKKAELFLKEVEK